MEWVNKVAYKLALLTSINHIHNYSMSYYCVSILVILYIFEDRGDSIVRGLELQWEIGSDPRKEDQVVEESTNSLGQGSLEESQYWRGYLGDGASHKSKASQVIFYEFWGQNPNKERGIVTPIICLKGKIIFMHELMRFESQNMSWR